MVNLLRPGVVNLNRPTVVNLTGVCSKTAELSKKVLLFVIDKRKKFLSLEISNRNLLQRLS